MDCLPVQLDGNGSEAEIIRTMEMHTTGEPTRIIYDGFPSVQGSTLLQKRADATLRHDDIRKRLMLEPRGHREMYGALLVNETEFTATGEAHVGVLFMHNEGWSTMCGHGTIALGRFLVDFDPIVCSNLCLSRKLELNGKDMTVEIKLHCPCGVVDVVVPVLKTSQGQLRSNPNRPVSFVNVPSFVTAIDVEIDLTSESCWLELGPRTKVKADFCYGGAFYCIISVRELGFTQGLQSAEIDALSRVTRKLKAELITRPQHQHLFSYKDNPDLSFLYGVIVTDDQLGHITDGASGAETGLCFFADQQVDRSPCGSGVAARRALAHEKGLLAPGEKFTFHSLVSNSHNGQGSFNASITKVLTGSDHAGVLVQVEGQAFYTGSATFLVEKEDSISKAGLSL